MKRKIATGLGLTLAAVLLSSQAFADTWTDNGTTSAWGTSEDGKTEVTYTVPSTYTVVIPASLAITAANTYVGDTNNVFIKTSSQVGETEHVKVTMPTGQTFKAVSGNSEIPLTISHKGNTATGETEVKSLTGVVTLLDKTGNDIGAVTPGGAETTTGEGALSATVKAKATAADIATAKIAGQHTGTIQFEVELT